MAGHQRHPLDDAFAAQNGTVHRAGAAGARRPDLKPIARMPRGDIEDLTPVIARSTPGPKNHNLTPLLGRRIMHDPATSLSRPIYHRSGDLADVGAWGIPNVASAAASLRARQQAQVTAAAKGGHRNATPIIGSRRVPILSKARPSTGGRTPPIIADDHLAAIDVPTPAKTILVGAGILAAFYFLAR